jgi:hypothetical protein
VSSTTPPPLSAPGPEPRPPVSRPAVDPGLRGRLALAVAAAVGSVGGARLTGGPGTEVSTQYPGGRVLGVRLGTDEVTVHVVAERLPLDAVAEAVRSAVRSALVSFGDMRTVAVAIDDLDVVSLRGGGAG